jgi:O-antigen ligase
VSSLGLPLDRERPLRPQIRESRPGELAVAVAACVLSGCLLATTGDWVAFAVVVGAFLVALGALFPAVFVVILLLGRPLLDDASNATAGVPSANVSGAVALALIVFTALTVARRRRLLWPQAASALLLALAVSVVSAIQARATLGPVVATAPAAEVVRLAALLSIYVLAANLFGTPETSRRLFVLVGLSGVLPALVGIYEWLSGPPVVEELGITRISGTFVGPVPFGLFLAVSALILMFLPRGALRPSLRVPAVLAVCVPLVGSSSREGWIVFAGGVLLLGWRARKLLVLAVAVAIVALLVAVPTIRERVLPVSTPAASTSAPQPYDSWHWRTANWKTLLAKWRERPVFGYGLRTTEYVNPRAPLETRSQPGGGFSAHSLLVRLLVEGGVILLAAYVAFFATLMRSLRPLARGAWELQSLGRLLWVIWALLLVASVSTDDPLDETALMIPLFALTGSLDAAYRARSSERGPSAGGRAAR